MNILIIGPALFDKGCGNRMTALRWGRIFEELGHRVTFADGYGDQSCDALVALHCIVSAESVAAFRAAHPGLPCVAVITGTDVYGLGSMFDEAGRAAAHRTMELATIIVAFQPLGLEEVPDAWSDKGVVIYQSAETSRAAREPREDRFEVCIVGDMREVKDPFRAALAARRLPGSSRLRVLHAGAAGDEAMAERAATEERANPRYTWLGEVPHDDALELMAGCRLLVVSSRHEGAPNVMSEALALGLPVVATRIPGNVGLLGEDYPGYFDVEDTEALCELLRRAEQEPEFYHSLRQACAELADLVSPQRERDAWEKLLDEVCA